MFVAEKRAGRKAGNIVTVTSGDLKIEDLPVALRFYESIRWTDDGKRRFLSFLSDSATPVQPVPSTPTPEAAPARSRVKPLAIPQKADGPAINAIAAILPIVAVAYFIATIARSENVVAPPATTLFASFSRMTPFALFLGPALLAMCPAILTFRRQRLFVGLEVLSVFLILASAFLADQLGYLWSLAVSNPLGSGSAVLLGTPALVYAFFVPTLSASIVSISGMLLIGTYFGIDPILMLIPTTVWFAWSYVYFVRRQGRFRNTTS